MGWDGAGMPPSAFRTLLSGLGSAEGIRWYDVYGPKRALTSRFPSGS